MSNLERVQQNISSILLPNLRDDFTEVWIWREYACKDSRADFVFDYYDQTYVIENKIGDTNHHFDQYLNDYRIPASHLGYIANYPIIQEGFETKTWTELYFHLSERIPKEEKNLWKAYMTYLKDICEIFETSKPMNLKGMFSLYTFSRCLDDVFAFDTEAFTSRVYNSKIDTKQGGNIQGTPRDGIMGKYFIMKLKKCYVKEARGWIGVYFNLENVHFYKIMC